MFESCHPDHFTIKAFRISLKAFLTYDELVAIVQDALTYKDFQYTILRVLSECITPEEAINIESLYKEKSSTRVYGLNMN